MSVQENALEGPHQLKVRKVGIALGVGIFFLPYIFAWFTLRAGHSLVARIVSFGWMAILLIVMASANGDGAPRTASTQPNRSLSQAATDAIVEPQMNAITDKVARDAVETYNLSRKGGDRAEICVHAGVVAASFLQAKDEPNYLRWKQTQRDDCEAAGIPSR